MSDGRQKLVYGRTIAEVTQAADELRDQDRAGLRIGDATTVDEWAKTWFSSYKSGLRSNTLAMYRNAYNKHIMPFLAALKLQEVRPIHIQEVMKAVGGKSESLQHKVLITMRQIFVTARQNGLMLKDPTEGIRTTPHAKPKRKEFLTLDEQKALMAALESADLRAQCFVGLCLYCGLRREEALGLQWGDIQDGKLTVNRAITFLNNQPDPIQELKTRSSHRTVPIPATLQALLNAAPHTGLYVIACVDGRPMTKIAFCRMWDKVKEVSPCEVRPHMLRHTYCSNLYRAGIDLKTAQYLMGHTTIQMTANVYTHMEKDDISTSITRLEAYLSGSSQQNENLAKVVKK